MAAIVKRLLTLWLALGFLLGATAQLLPCSAASAETGMRAEMPAGCDMPKSPCAGHHPSCVDHIGCVTVSFLPISPPSPPTTVRWISVAYHFASAPLSGLSIKPELTPPILAA